MSVKHFSLYRNCSDLAITFRSNSIKTQVIWNHSFPSTLSCSCNLKPTVKTTLAFIFTHRIYVSLPEGIHAKLSPRTNIIHWADSKQVLPPPKQIPSLPFQSTKAIINPALTNALSLSSRSAEAVMSSLFWPA